VLGNTPNGRSSLSTRSTALGFLLFRERGVGQVIGSVSGTLDSTNVFSPEFPLSVNGGKKVRFRHTSPS
jgi:hypothetical protein